MLTENVIQKKDIPDLSSLPVAIEPDLDHELINLVACLAPGTPWGDRQIAAQRLGNKRDQRAVPALLEALPDDNFWMVRCAIIQALEKIGDPKAVPTLRKVEVNDAFQIVQSYACKAIERLTEKL